MTKHVSQIEFTIILILFSPMHRKRHKYADFQSQSDHQYLSLNSAINKYSDTFRDVQELICSPVTA